MYEIQETQQHRNQQQQQQRRLNGALCTEFVIFKAQQYIFLGAVIT